MKSTSTSAGSGLRELHLFAGIGGGVLGGMLLGHKCVGAVEIDPYCRRVLEARQRDGSIEQFPIFDDVRTFDGKPWRGRVDVVCGGFPCQPWSQAGKRLGAADPRHLWPEMFRIVSETRPRWVFAENVSMAAFAEPWRDLRWLGYRVPPALCLSAESLGAPFRRNRWWLLAADTDRLGGRVSGAGAEWAAQATATHPSDPDRERCEERSIPARQGREGHGARRPVGGGQEVGDDHSAGLAQRQSEPCDNGQKLAPAFGATWRAAAPRLRRLVSGAARGMDSRCSRIRAVGNAQVPAVAAAAFTELMARHFGTEATA